MSFEFYIFFIAVLYTFGEVNFQITLQLFVDTVIGIFISFLNGIF